MCHLGAVMEMKEKNMLVKSLNQYLLLSISSYFILYYFLVCFRKGKFLLQMGKN